MNINIIIPNTDKLFKSALVAGLPSPRDPKLCRQAKEATQKYIETVIPLLNAQDQFDPPHFVTHKASIHSVRVADISDDFFKKFIKHIEISKVLPDSLTDYPEWSKWIIRNICLLHDIGYPQIHDKMKANHSYEGAKLLLRHIKPSLINMLESHGLNKESSECVVEVFREAIYYHNADQKSCFYCRTVYTSTGKVLANQSPKGDFFYERHSPRLGRPISAPETSLNRNIKYGLAYQETHLDRHFFRTVLMLADNLDTNRGRLLNHQKRVLSFLVKSLEDMKTPLKLKETALSKLPKDFSKDEEVFYELLKSRPNERKYFFGIYGLENCDFKFQEDTLIIEINPFKACFSLFQQILVVSESGRWIPLIEFYADRISDSLNSIHAFEKPPVLKLNIPNS